jgi:hypothetical protein
MPSKGFLQYAEVPVFDSGSGSGPYIRIFFKPEPKNERKSEARQKERITFEKMPAHNDGS